VTRSFKGPLASSHILLDARVRLVSRPQLVLRSPIGDCNEVRAAALQHVRGTPISQEEEDMIEVEESQSSKQPRRESSSSEQLANSAYASSHHLIHATPEAW